MQHLKHDNTGLEQMQRLLLQDLLKETRACTRRLEDWEVPYAIEEIKQASPESLTDPIVKCYEQPTLWQWVKLHIFRRSPWR